MRFGLEMKGVSMLLGSSWFGGFITNGLEMPIDEICCSFGDTRRWVVY
jgi:hypothetical protein